MAIIKAIETRYKGYRFRSRLEARWAVFFDSAGIEWSYEREGYEVDGKKYLPDFYLPKFDAFFEVKGTNDFDEALLQGLSTGSEKKVILAVGDIPDTDNWAEEWSGFTTFFPSDEAQQEDGVAWGYEDVFLRCDGCRGIRYANSDLGQWLRHSARTTAFGFDASRHVQDILAE
jgi:hypothetical protein